jgi:hypothetical protein
VVATGHRPQAVEQAISTNESLLAVNIVPANAEAAV